MKLSEKIRTAKDRGALLGKIYTHNDGEKWYLLQIDGVFFDEYLCTFERVNDQKIRRINASEFE